MHDARIAQLDEVLEPYRMRRCESLQQVARDGLSLEVAREIARQYYAGNAASPQILAAGIAQIANEDLRVALVSNLYEECGKGDKNQSHVTLFKRFMQAVDVTEADAPLVPGSKMHKLIDTYMKVCTQGPDYRALAILHGFEDVFAYICDLIAQGIEKSGVVDAHAGEFFPLHSVADIAHAERMRASMLGAADTEDKWQQCLQLASLGASLLYDLFDDRPAQVELGGVRRAATSVALTPQLG